MNQKTTNKTSSKSDSKSNSKKASTQVPSAQMPYSQVPFPSSVPSAQVPSPPSSNTNGKTTKYALSAFRKTPSVSSLPIPKFLPDSSSTSSHFPISSVNSFSNGQYNVMPTSIESLPEQQIDHGSRLLQLLRTRHQVELERTGKQQLLSSQSSCPNNCIGSTKQGVIQKSLNASKEFKNQPDSQVIGVKQNGNTNTRGNESQVQRTNNSNQHKKDKQSKQQKQEKQSKSEKKEKKEKKIVIMTRKQSIDSNSGTNTLHSNTQFNPVVTSTQCNALCIPTVTSTLSNTQHMQCNPVMTNNPPKSIVIQRRPSTDTSIQSTNNSIIISNSYPMAPTGSIHSNYSVPSLVISNQEQQQQRPTDPLSIMSQDLCKLLNIGHHSR